MIIIFGILLMLFLGGLISFYYYKLIERFFRLFKDSFSKFKKLFIFIAIILGIFSINIFSIIGLFLIHFIFISLIVDGIFYIVRKIFKDFDKSIFKKIYLSSIIPLVCTTIILGYGYFNIRNVVETDYTLYTEKDLGEDLRILLITDTHYETIFGKEKLDEYKNVLDEVNADIVILGGDIVDEATSKDGMNDIFVMLGSIKNKYGIYYVTGNHDEQQYSNSKKFNKEELDNVIEDNNITIIDEKYVEVNDNIVIAGRKDYSYGQRKSVKEILTGVDSDKYIIMVDHEPVQYQENVDRGVDLIVSGHTHAGQVFPVHFFIDIFKTADLCYGNKNFDGMEGIVSSGMAGWGYPIRTEKHSEYVVIDVKEKKA